MKASKFSDAQKAFFLKQGNDGVPVAEICRKAGISQATYFNWKKKYDGMQPPEMRRLKQLEDENSKLKKIVAEWGETKLCEPSAIDAKALVATGEAPHRVPFAARLEGRTRKGARTASVPTPDLPADSI
jgi:putative transposase